MVVKVRGGIITDQMLAGNLRYLEIDEGAAGFSFALGGYPSDNFTAPADNYEEQAASATIDNAGSGYAVGDVVTVSGGTLASGGSASTFTVAAVDSGGGVTRVTLLNAGDYQISPDNPVPTTTGGGGTNCVLNVSYTGVIAVLGTNRFVAARQPVPNSAVEQVCEVITQKATIVQVALMPLAEGASFQVAVANTGFGWNVADDDLRDAIRALGTITVPYLTSAGDTVDLSAVTVTERFLYNGLNN